MLGALAAAGTAFYEALPNHVPLKYEIRARLEDEIALSEVIRQKACMQETAVADTTGETTFDMVHADCSKRCKDKELEASLDCVDIRFLSRCTGWLVFFVSFLTALSNCGFFFSRDWESRQWLESLSATGIVCRIFVPLAIAIASVILSCQQQNRAAAYEKELRLRIILDRIKK